MDAVLLVVADLVAISVLAFGVYFRRYRRRDLAVAYLGVNVGVLAVALVLAASTVGAGLGLGLFGVLSIIRLRSREIDQHEVAYYFAALALGLIAGLGAVDPPLAAGLMALVVAVLAIGDSPRLLRRYRQQVLVLDRAIADEAELAAHVAAVLRARVHTVKIERLDLVNDTTIVDVRFEIPRPGIAAPAIERIEAERVPA